MIPAEMAADRMS